MRTVDLIYTGDERRGALKAIRERAEHIADLAEDCSLTPGDDDRRALLIALLDAFAIDVMRFKHVTSLDQPEPQTKPIPTRGRRFQ